MNIACKHLGSLIRRSRRPALRWLSGALLTWLLFVSIGVPLAEAQTKQGPNTAPATSKPADSAKTKPSNKAQINPKLATGVVSATRPLSKRPGGAALGLAAGVVAAGAMLFRRKPTAQRPQHQQPARRPPGASPAARRRAQTRRRAHPGQIRSSA
jgi:hypothetical protein